MYKDMVKGDAELLLNIFNQPHINNRDPDDTTLDIGCGEGDGIATRSFLLPDVLPNTRVVAVDKCPWKILRLLIEHGKVRIDYLILNIEGDITGLKQKRGASFKKAFSFYGFNTVQNIPRALKNVFELLTPDGEFYMVFVVKCPIYEAYKVLKQNEMYSKYMQDVSYYFTPLSNVEKPQIVISGEILNAGFQEQTTLYYHRAFRPGDMEELIVFTRASVQVFMDRMPDEIKNFFLSEALGVIFNHNRANYDFQSNSIPYQYEFHILICKAKKCARRM